jgi:hypothetical protein
MLNRLQVCYTKLLLFNVWVLLFVVLGREVGCILRQHCRLKIIFISCESLRDNVVPSSLGRGVKMGDLKMVS